MSSQDPRRQISLEQLLQLKRAERPDPEFWNRFEHELRQKQLAALLERRPWWHSFSRLLTRRVYLPVGATAAMAFTLVSLRYYGPTQLAHNGEGLVPAATLAPALEAEADSAAPAETVAAVAGNPAIDDRTPVAAPALSEEIPASTDRLTPWGAAPAAVPQRSLASTFVQLEPVVTESTTAVDLVGATPDTGAEVVRASAVARPLELAAVAAIASRRSRLLAEMNDRRFQPEPQAPEIVRERLARRLADQDFSDRFSRLGVKGDQVSLKF